MNTSIFKFFKMKSLIGSLSAFMLSFTAFGQIYSTGEVTLTIGFTVEIEVNTTTNIVTMTMVGPDTQWLGVAFAASGSSMGDAGDDVVVYNNSGFQDRNMTGSNGTPNLDGTQDWTLESDMTSGGVRTIEATRARDTGDANDYVFPNSAQPLSMMWALGNALGFSYHGSRGGAMANFVLSSESVADFSFEVYPNPVQDRLQLLFGQALPKAEVVLHNNLGQEVMRHTVGGTEAELDASSLAPGMYLLQLRSEGRQAVKTLVKE